MQSEIVLANGAKLMIRNPKINVGGKGYPVSVVNASKEYFAPAEVFAKPVTTRGRTYAVPTSHNGKPIDDLKIVTFAALGISYYTAFPNDLERDGWNA